MRVNGTGGPSGIHKPTSAAKGKSAKKTAGKRDSVQVADAASLRAKAHTMLAEMDEVRMQRIEAIRSALEKGSFQSDSRKVAAHIVANAMAEHPWS